MSVPKRSTTAVATVKKGPKGISLPRFLFPIAIRVKKICIETEHIGEKQCRKNSGESHHDTHQKSESYVSAANPPSAGNPITERGRTLPQ